MREGREKEIEEESEKSSFFFNKFFLIESL